MKQDDVLGRKVCGCGTVQELIDEAIAVSMVDDSGCNIWEMMLAMMVIQIRVNLFHHLSISEEGLSPDKAERRTGKVTNLVTTAVERIMQDCDGYIADAVNARLKEKNKTEGSPDEEPVEKVVGTIH